MRTIKAPKFNKALSVKYYKLLRTLLLFVNEEFQKTVIKGLSTKEMVSKTIKDESPNERFKKMFALFNKRLSGKMSRERITKLVKKIINATDRYALGGVDKQLKSFGIDLEKAGLLKKYSSFLSTTIEENVNLVKNLVEEQSFRLQSIVLRNMREGVPSTELAKQIQKSLGITKRRATLIARTETHKLSQQLSDLRMKEVGVKKAIWRAVMDNRTSDQHRKFDGKTFDIDKGIYDKDEGTWNLPARRPNCRCWAEYIIE